jgi:D-sedoheptulose 7-phosphate isomerase
MENLMTITEYNEEFFSSIKNVILTSESGESLNIDEGVEYIKELIIRQSHSNKKLIFFGNGASSSIASHMSADYSKRGSLRAITFSDAALLTCLSNDLGYENVFSEAISIYADSGDIIIPISSSGESVNIINATKTGKEKGCHIITFSGFSDKNKLRFLGKYNIFVPVKKYGFVETAHHLLLHGILDLLCQEYK